MKKKQFTILALVLVVIVVVAALILNSNRPYKPTSFVVDGDNWSATVVDGSSIRLELNNNSKVPLASIPLPANNRKCCIFFVNAKQKEVQTRCLCLNTRSVFLTIEAGIPRIAVDNLWNTGRQVRGPTFSVSILFPVKADALFLPPFTLSPPKSPRSNGICIAFLRSAMECGNANMLRFDEYGRMEVAA